MDKQLIGFFETIEKLDLQKLKKFWGLSESDDEFVINLRQKFLRLRYQIPDMIDNLKEGEMIGIRRYTTEKFKWEKYYFIPFIGKISDIDKFIPKYLLYANLIRSQVINHYDDNEIIDQIKAYLLGKEGFNKDENNDCFFFKIVWGKNTSYTIEQPQIQIYGFNYDDAVLNKFEKPWWGELCDFMADEDLYICSAEDMMSQADTFIKDNINENPLFGIDMLNDVINKAKNS